MNTPLSPPLRNSLRRKVLVPVLIVGMGILAAAVFIIYSAVDAQVQHRLKGRADLIAAMLGAVSGKLENSTDLQTMVKPLATGPGIARIIVLAGDDPLIIASTNAEWLGKKPGELLEEDIARHLMEILGAHSHKTPVAGPEGEFTHTGRIQLNLQDIATGQPFDATVLISLQTEAIQEQVKRSVFLLGLSLTGAFLVLGALAYRLFFRHVLLPLDTLERQIIGGSPANEIDVGKSAGDQIGSLAGALKHSLLQGLKQQSDLRKSEARFRRLTEGMQDVVWVLDPATQHFRYISPSCEKLYGYTVDEMMAVKIEESVIPPGEEFEKVQRLIREGAEAFLSGKIGPDDYLKTEIRNNCKDGSQRWVDISYNFQRNEDSGEVEIAGVSRDTTDRRRNEEALRLSEERHRLLADHARDVIWTMELDGTVSYVSPSVEKVRSFTPEECLRHSLEETLIPESQPGVIAYLQNLHAAVSAGRRPEPFRGQQGYWRKDGSVLWCEVIAFPLLRADGSFVQLLGMSRDISEHKAMQAAMQQARDASDSANRAKSEFLANMSHEIRTPMNAVIGLSNLLREGISDPAQRDYAEQVHRAGTALLGVLDDILDYSRMEAGQLQIENVVLSIAEVLEDCRALFAAHPSLDQVKLTFDVSPDVPNALKGDPLRLLQVVKNLVGNALKFTSRGSIDVRVGVLEQTADAILLRFSVQDTGIGLAREQTEKIFEAFNQGDIATTRKFGGTGLGLSISRRLVGLMGGDIGVESTPGVGSNFWFTAHLEKPTVGEVGSPRAASARQSLEDLSTLLLPIRDSRVLVVDDTQTNLLVAEQYLRRLGMVVDTASSAQDAVTLAKANSFDAILMDLQMPGMDGLAAARLIREWEASEENGHTHVPIIALTAAAMAGDIQACHEAGMDDHIAKPINPAHLAETLNRWIPDKS